MKAPDAATAVACGDKPPVPQAKIRKWTPYRNTSGTMLGFINVRLPSGLIVNEIKLMVGPNGGHWLAMPAVKAIDRDGQPITNRDGKGLWNNFVEFDGREFAKSSKGRSSRHCAGSIPRPSSHDRRRDRRGIGQCPAGRQRLALRLSAVQSSQSDSLR
jgi:hypothetical protein